MDDIKKQIDETKKHLVFLENELKNKIREKHFELTIDNLDKAQNCQEISPELYSVLYRDMIEPKFNHYFSGTTLYLPNFKKNSESYNAIKKYNENHDHNIHFYLQLHGNTKTGTLNLNRKFEGGECNYRGQLHFNSCEEILPYMIEKMKKYNIEY